MKKMLCLLLAIFSVLGVSNALTTCSPIAGANQIWSRPALRWVLVGEIHGSNETPDAFKDLVCDALARGKRVTVALEQSSAEQPALNRILTAKDLSRATQELLHQTGWTEGSIYGKASKSMLRLLLSLRELRSSYPSLTIFAFDVPYTGKAAGARDEAMGKALLSLGEKRPQDLVLALIGNAHIFRAPMFGYDPTAMYLPARESLSIEVTDNGGKFWNDVNDACGPNKGGAPARGGNMPREVVLKPSLAPFGKVDGILSLGMAATPSPPAVGEITPIPACRKKFIAGHQQPSA